MAEAEEPHWEGVEEEEQPHSVEEGEAKQTGQGLQLPVPELTEPHSTAGT